jgi:hypothetical protein
MYSGSLIFPCGSSAFGVVGDEFAVAVGHSKADLKEISETAVWGSETDEVCLPPRHTDITVSLSPS